MATDLRCPRCEAPLSSESAECPLCASASRRSTRSSRISTSQQFKAPPGWVVPARGTPTSPDETECPTGSSRRWIFASIAGIVGLLALVGTWRWLQSPRATPGPEAVVASAPKEVGSKPALKASSTTKPLLELPPPDDARIETKPVPAIRKVRDLPPDLASPVRSTTTLPMSSSVPVEKVDAAIEKGVRWLREHPNAWLSGSDHSLGYVSLPGLALLESGAEPNDELILRAAKRVRELAVHDPRTYDISLAILFLDRLGDPADSPLIRRLAARLIAGQTPHYGWTYTNRLSREHEESLLKAIESVRPQIELGMPLAREPGKGLIELEIPIAGSARPPGPPKSGMPKSGTPKLMMPLELPAEAQRLVRELPKELQRIPVFDPEATNPRGKFRGSYDDNSNSQFAMLALWAAQRHGVPVERSLLLADLRFAQTQSPSGGWGYHVHGGRDATTPSMTCVGLLGLAVGHGSLLSSEKPGRPGHGNVDDPAIQKGLDALSKWIGVPGDPDDGGSLNLYKLWSIERVCVLYGLPTISGKDWYGWGATRILRDQQRDGAWNGGGYPGSSKTIDTSFALLFLRRSNLVQDLSDRLQLHMPIRDPERP